MRRKLLLALAHSVRRAAILSAFGLVAALALGVGGYALTSVEGHPTVSIASATSSTPPIADVTALAAMARPSTVEGRATPAISIVPFREQPQALSTSLGNTPASAPLRSTIAAPESEVVVAAAAARSIPAAPPANSTPALGVGDTTRVPVSFYYCTAGSTTAARGDGGGFCGRMRDGSVVYNGAAACDFAYLGQRFRIQGDPLGRVYRCADTGSAVHGLHRDIWFNSSDEGWKWQLTMGQTVAIEIVP